MKWFFLLTLVSSSFPGFAEVSPQEVGSMLEQMVRENVISRSEADKAQARMENMNPGQWKKINETAAKAASRMPASTVVAENKIENVQSVDLDGEQFKAIQNDLQKIAPQTQE